METDSPFGTLGITARLPLPYEEAVARAKAALKEEGFGVLTEIDVRATLREKIGAEIRPYCILGACNPKLAHQALNVSAAVGLMLPCNVVVTEAEGGSVVSAMDPEAGLAAVGAEGLEPIAAEAKARLCRVLAALEAGASGA